ncbi:hypothetical protein J6590_092491 [Homalodisca vitripennis]|nr:hypothetical protein J6590_092491 [Homalodisca vitripennis]
MRTAAIPTRGVGGTVSNLKPPTHYRTCWSSSWEPNVLSNIFESVWAPTQHARWFCWVGCWVRQHHPTPTARLSCWAGCGGTVERLDWLDLSFPSAVA